MPSKQCLDLCLTKQLGTIALLLLTHKINSHVTESFTHTHTHTITLLLSPPRKQLRNTFAI